MATILNLLKIRDVFIPRGINTSLIFSRFRIVAIYGIHRGSFPNLVRVFCVTEEMREVSYGFALIFGGFSRGGTLMIVDDMHRLAEYGKRNESRTFLGNIA